MKRFFLTTLLIFGLTFFNLNGVLASTWAPPTARPPGGNTEEPLDESSRAQTKSGNLTINGTLTVTDVQGPTDINTSSGIAVIGETEGSTSNDIGIYGIAPTTGWAGWFQGHAGITRNLLVGDPDDTTGSSIILWARGGTENADAKLTISGTGNTSGQVNITLSEIFGDSPADFPNGKINIFNAQGTNGWDLDEVQIQADKIYLTEDSDDEVIVAGDIAASSLTLDSTITSWSDVQPDILWTDQATYITNLDSTVNIYDDGRLSVGSSDLQLGANESLIYGQINSTQTQASDFIKFDKGTTEYFSINRNGYLYTKGDITTDGNLTLNNVIESTDANNFYINGDGSVQIRIDYNQSSLPGDNVFRVNNGANNTIFEIDESGNADVIGNLTASAGIFGGGYGYGGATIFSSGTIGFDGNINGVTINMGAMSGISTLTTTGDVTVGGSVDFGLNYPTNSCSSQQACSVACNAGESIIGGGCNITSGTANLVASYPDSSLNTWECEISKNGPVTVTAICARVE